MSDKLRPGTFCATCNAPTDWNEILGIYMGKLAEKEKELASMKEEVNKAVREFAFCVKEKIRLEWGFEPEDVQVFCADVDDLLPKVEG